MTKKIYSEDAEAPDNEYVDETYEAWKKEGLSYVGPTQAQIKKMQDYLNSDKNDNVTY